MKNISVGILGCGSIVKKHTLHLRNIPYVDIVAVADRDRDRARTVADRLGIRHVFPDLPNMLRDARPEVVHVLSPPQTHHQLSIQAMESGCHVFVEKPMALNVDEADEMIAAAKQNGRVLSVCHDRLFEPPVIRARRLVASGAIGSVVGVEIFWRTWRARDPGRNPNRPWVYDLPGCIFHESAPHPLYLLLALLKDSTVVSAVSRKTGNDLALPADELRVVLDGASGFGCLSISVGAHPYQVFVTIYGTEMTLRIDLTNNTLIKMRTDDSEGNISKALVNLDYALQLLSETATNAVRTIAGRLRRGHGILIEGFYRSLRDGTDPPVTGKDGLAVVVVLDQILAKLAR